MNAPQILLIVFFSFIFLRRILVDFFQGCNKYVDSDNSVAKIFGHVLGALFYHMIYFGIIFGLLIWGNFFSSK